jgi:Flp pilus assembly CpaE family ATPase
LSDFVVTKAMSLATAVSGRRSTRICKPVSVSVCGPNLVGNSVSQFTSTISQNCHGCLYPSRHHYRPGSWVTLEIRSQQASGKSLQIRAQVKFVAMPQKPKELYRVGVEFETPSNIWGIDTPPEDWLQFSVSFSALAVPYRAAALVSANEVSTETKLSVHPRTIGLELSQRLTTDIAEYFQQGSPTSAPWLDQMLATLNEALLQTAEKAVTSAVAFHVNRALQQAEQTIERITQASVLKVEEHELFCGHELITLARGEVLELLGGLQADLTHSREELRKEFSASLSEAQRAGQELQQKAADLRRLQSDTLDALGATARELKSELSAQGREIADGAMADSRTQTPRASYHPAARALPPSATMLGRPLNGSNLSKTQIIPAPASENGNSLRPIAVIGTKGGVGTSTIAVNLGVQFAQITSKKTVLLDFSRPLGSVSLLLDLEPRYRLGDALESLERLDSSLLAGLLTRHKSGLEVLAGVVDPSQWERIPISSLDRLVQVALGTFDFTVIDFGSTYSTECSTILDPAEILLVTQADVPGLANLSRHLSVLFGLNVPHERIKVIVNRWHPADDKALETVETSLKSSVFARLPNDFQQVREAITTGTPFSNNRTNPLVTAFRELAQRLSGSAQIQQSKRRSLLDFLTPKK